LATTLQYFGHNLPSWRGRCDIFSSLCIFSPLCTLIGLERYSYDEASAPLGIPVGSVGPLYIRAKSRLRQALESW